MVSWDGAADWVIDRLLADGKLPNVARMAREGASADHMTQAFPSKTAVGHYALFSGTWPRASGITNNSVPLLPRSDHTILETRTGFDGRAHLTEPIWVTFAKAGKTAVCLSAAGSSNPKNDQERLRKAGVPLKRLVTFSGFESNFGVARVMDLAKSGGAAEVQLGDSKVRVEATKTNGRFDHVSVTCGDQSETLRAEPTGSSTAWGKPIRVFRGKELGITYFRLFEIDPESGRTVLYMHSVAAIQGTQSREESNAYLEAYGGFHDDPWRPYESGELGKTLFQDGNGVAEERLLDTIRLDQELLKRAFRYGLNRYRGDITFEYTPNSDSAGHTWMGVLDPSSGAYNADLAAKIWPYYTRVFQLQDEWLGDMMAAAGKGTAFALVSDHGMAGDNQRFNANVVLQKAGLVVVKDGKIDISKTRICVPPWGDNQLVVNSTDWKGGIVPLAEKTGVIAAAEKALLEARDPKTNEPIVKRVFRADDTSDFGIGGPAGGDLSYDVAPNYYFGSAVSGEIVSPVAGPIGQGVHGFWPQRREMHAICYLWGPGIAPGVKLPGIRSIDVAPTLCRLMRVPLSPDNQGIVIGQALRNR